VTKDCREPDPGTEWDSVSPGGPQQEEEFNVLLPPEKEIEEVIKKDWRTEGTEEKDMEQETEDWGKRRESWRMKGDNVWDCTDLKWLGAKLAELREEKIAGRCCIHWKAWEETCGGAEL
jgi:hypothetical protein